MTLSGKVSLKVKMTILIIEILIIGLYGVVVGAKIWVLSVMMRSPAWKNM